MDKLVLLFISIFPVALIAFIIYKADRREKEPIKELVKAFLFGVLSVFITLIISYVLNVVDFDTENASMIEIFIYSFLSVALVEEFSKWICGYLFLRNNKEYDYMFDGIVYFVYVALGFACVENILYTFDSGIVTGIIRAISTVPGHAFFGVACGYYYSLYKKEKTENTGNGKKYLFLSLLVPILLHGFYDFCLFSQNTILIIIYLIFVVFLYIYSIGNIKRMGSMDNPFLKSRRYCANCGRKLDSCICGGIVVMPNGEHRKNFCANCGKKVEECTCGGVVIRQEIPEKKKNFCSNCGKKIEECTCNSNINNVM